MSVWLKVGYELSEHSTVGIFYLYEDYTIDSFIQQGLKPYLASTLLLVANDGDYQANVFGVNMRFRF